MELQVTSSILQSLNLCLANGLGVDTLWLRLCLPATGPGVDFALKLIRGTATQTRLTRPQVPSLIPGTLEAQCLPGAYLIGLDPRRLWWSTEFKACHLQMVTSLDRRLKSDAVEPSKPQDKMVHSTYCSLVKHAICHQPKEQNIHASKCESACTGVISRIGLIVIIVRNLLRLDWGQLSQWSTTFLGICSKIIQNYRW